MIERSGGDAAHFAEELRRILGVAVQVDFQRPGATAAVTGVDRRQKPIRLVDERR